MPRQDEYSSSEEDGQQPISYFSMGSSANAGANDVSPHQVDVQHIWLTLK